MGFDVSGWVEYNWSPPDKREDHSRWHPLLSVDAFNLIGDEISNYLFGLANGMNRDARSSREVSRPTPAMPSAPR